jgi:hypothetical protein
MMGRLGAVVMVLSVSILLGTARRALIGESNPTIAQWSSHVIFGCYFAVMAVAIQTLPAVLERSRSTPARQAVLLLVLITVCMDLVLVNVQETVSALDASYGIVVLWDVTVFFLWLRVIDLCRPENAAAFQTSLLVTIAPALKLGREVLFLPYAPPAERAYLDLLFGDLPVVLWALVLARSVPSDGDERESFLQRLLMWIVVTGTIYWCAVAVENIASLAWPSLGRITYEALARQGLPPHALNVFYFAFALVATALLLALDPLKVARRLGLRE